MYKKLDESSINLLMETAINEFAEHGPDRANMSTIAKKSGLSVGVIYNYFTGKDGLFLACVRHSLKVVASTLGEAAEGGGTQRDCVERLIRGLIKQSREHPNYNALYNEITSGSCRRFAPALAEEIESDTAALYSKVFSSSEAAKVADPRIFAFFFDNLLMMLQFSYSCEYYRHRMEIFCGEDILDNDELIVDMFMKFVEKML